MLAYHRLVLKLPAVQWQSHHAAKRGETSAAPRACFPMTIPHAKVDLLLNLSDQETD